MTGRTAPQEMNLIISYRFKALGLFVNALLSSDDDGVMCSCERPWVRICPRQTPCVVQR